MPSPTDDRIRILLDRQRQRGLRYRLLMALICAGILLGVVAVRHLTRTFDQIVKAGQVRALQVDRLSEMRRQLSEIDDPGDMVLFNHRTDKEEADLDAAITRFRASLRQEREALEMTPTDPDTLSRLDVPLDRVAVETDTVVGDATRMFADLRAGHLDVALRANADIDHHVDVANSALTDLHGIVSDMQQGLYATQLSLSRSLLWLQYAWAGGLLVFVFLGYVSGCLYLASSTRQATEMLRRQEELVTSEARYRSLSEAAPIGIVETSVEGRCRYVNERLIDILGQPMERLLERGWTSSIHPDDLPTLLPAFQAAAALGQPWEGEYRIVQPQGTVRYLRSHFAPMRHDGYSLGTYVGTVEDVTDARTLTVALQTAREAAEAASRAKSEFLANMSHEIRTPLNGIMGMTDLVLSTHLDATQTRYLNLVKHSGQTLVQVINDILDFSKIEAGKLELIREPVDLRRMLGDIVQTLAIQAHQKGLDIVDDVGAEVPAAVFGDGMRLRQVLVNLAGNAVKFTDRGEVVIRLSATALPGGSWQVDFAVQDTGMGISEEQQQAIFEPFVQADGSSTRAHGGTGLGLTISTRLVSGMGGSLKVKSQRGQGSTFYFTLEMQPAPALPARPAPELLKGRSVLVVDDNATNLLVLQRMLGQWGLRVTTADGGRNGVEAARRAGLSNPPFDLVLTDLHMPDLDGFGVVEALRNLGLKNLAILMLTSGDRPGDLDRCRRLGIVSCLVKPVRQSDLLDSVLAALELTSPPPPPAEPASELAAASEHPLHVLVADDYDVNQMILQEVLEGRGHSVTLVDNGQQALEAATLETFDVIVMDVEMPDMDGLEAATRIRRQEEGSGRHVPILALTAHALKGDQERCVAAGMDAYMAKPVDVLAMAETVERLGAPVAARVG